jgi:hypothetical protein
MQWLLMGIVAVAGCVETAEPTTRSLPPDSAVVLTKPDRVEAYLVGKLADHPGAGGKVAGFGVLRSITAPEEVALGIAAIAADPANFGDTLPVTDFAPVIAYRFYKGDQGVDVLLSFRQDSAMLVERDAHRKEIYRRVYSIAPSRDKFARWAGRTFPSVAWATSP